MIIKQRYIEIVNQKKKLYKCSCSLINQTIKNKLIAWRIKILELKFVEMIWYFQQFFENEWCITDSLSFQFEKFLWFLCSSSERMEHHRKFFLIERERSKSIFIKGGKRRRMGFLFFISQKVGFCFTYFCFLLNKKSIWIFSF